MLRVSLTISGAVSLGAYEAGVLTALLYGLRPVAAGDDPAVRLDVMGGASAGAITALLTARTLQQGLDPYQVMHEAWVVEDSLGALLSRTTDAPLSLDALEATARRLLGPRDAGSGEAAPRQQADVALSYTLACLRGLDYRLARLNHDSPVQATTYVDHYEHVLRADTPVEDLLGPPGSSPLDAVLASAANPLGFPARLLDRGADWTAYRRRGVSNLPPGDDHVLWYTDGGTLENEPLGRTLELVNRVAASDDDRLHLLIHPDPTAAVRGRDWADPEQRPGFVRTALRVLELQRTQSLYGDLEQVEKTNGRLASVRQVSDRLAAALGDLAPADQDRVRAVLQDALGTMTEQAHGLQRQRLGPDADLPDLGGLDDDGAGGGDGAGGDGGGDGAGPGADLGALLRTAFGRAAGLSGKRDAQVQVISPVPLAAAHGRPVDELLSGEQLFAFGGFLSETLRRNDFDLGYASAVEWLNGPGLPGAGLPAAAVDTVRRAASEAYAPGDGWQETGHTTALSLLTLAPWQLAKLTGKLGRVLAHDLTHPPDPPAS